MLRWCFSVLLAALQGAQRTGADVGMELVQLPVTIFLTVIHPAFDSALQNQIQHASHHIESYRYLNNL